MLLDLVAVVIQKGGLVASAVLLSVVLFAAKFGYYRRFDQIDFVVGISELPTIVTATCCSLIVAALYLRNDDARLAAGYLLISLLVLLGNFVCYRIIEYRKLILSERPFCNLSIISLSYFAALTVSLAAAVRSYEGIVA